MNKKNFKLLALLGLIGLSANLTARVFVTPEALERGYAFNHYPFARADYEDCKSECKWLYVDIWGAGLHKSANNAFGNCDSTKKQSLANLFFGAETFKASDAFVPGTVAPAFPLLFIANITPTFDYSEDMAIFGANFETRVGCNEQWGLGLRARVPFRSTKATLDSCCNLEDITNVDQLAFEQNELDFDANYDGTNPLTDRGQINDAFAYRLDLVALLHKNLNTNDPSDLILQFHNTTKPLVASPITIGDVDLDQPSHPVHVIDRNNGIAPLFPDVPYFGLRGTANVNGGNIGSVNGPLDNTAAHPSPLPSLAANGSGVANNARARFDAAIDYTALGATPVNQSRLWLVPTLEGLAANASFALSNGAADVQATIKDALNQVTNSSSSVDFLLSNSLSFDTARRNGIGNLDTEIYARYDGCLCNGAWFAEGIFGVRWPTDKLNNFPGQLLAVPTGNNHHYELKLGGYLGWQPCEWFAVKADAWYFWALKHQERLNAPFKGATVANIGPAICGDVSWQYFIGDIDFTFLVPCAGDYIGFDVGYQAWVKRKDNVSFNVTSAKDFFGVTQPLDSCLLENHTKRVAHTVKAEIFKQCCNWQLFAGWEHTFAGKNALNDTDWYLGLVVNF